MPKTAIDEIARISSKHSLQDDDVTALSGLLEDLKAEKQDNALSELNDIFPALKAYKTDHTEINLQKLCVEISEFCRAVYASTRNDAERDIYRAMLEKLNK